MAIREAAKYKKVLKIRDLKLPIVIPATDIDSGEKFVFTNSETEKDYYIKDSKIEIAVRASSSYPGVFAPCIYKQHKFVDGGILDNIPADEVKNIGADKVIAVKFALSKNEKTKGIYAVAIKAIDMLFDKRSLDEVAIADYVLDINVFDANVFNIKKINDCYKYGYEQTISKMDEIKKILNEL